ncbi:hypothetical protein CU024_1118 [Enterococcus faecium]|nr:hypothetical protein [Enterococcus faecium]MBK4762608.1 hypothetical protein [Enterococcus faecium]MBK4786995.1 hypothetical protein [Enterococcus faecium]MBK4789418.1 hypothetical protein [Enterococcus faecium]MBK4797811.1 hypothetical protein [Enterococcus faecium]
MPFKKPAFLKKIERTAFLLSTLYFSFSFLPYTALFSV